jgi:hypothetical protein
MQRHRGDRGPGFIALDLIHVFTFTSMVKGSLKDLGATLNKPAGDQLMRRCDSEVVVTRSCTGNGKVCHCQARTNRGFVNRHV